MFRTEIEHALSRLNIDLYADRYSFFLIVLELMVVSQLYKLLDWSFLANPISIEAIF